MAKTLEQLNRMFRDAEEVDRETFAEMRSNLLLISGEHYDRVTKKQQATCVRQIPKPLGRPSKVAFDQKPYAQGQTQL